MLRTRNPRTPGRPTLRLLQPRRLAAAILATAIACTPAEEPNVTIYRDSWGVPHIYAETAEAGLYASGWAQAHDRLEQILKNYLLGLGEYAAAFGPGDDDRWVRSDFDSKRWRHGELSKEHYESKLNPELRGHLAAFVRGINDYLDEHQDEVPDWWGDRRVDVYMPVAFSRQFIWGWPAGQAARDLRQAGLEPSYDVDLRASNEIALAPERTTFGAAALIIDPHLSWLGRQRYWELRLHAGDLHISGFATAGFPYVNLGHNDHIAWAHTTGGPDTADVYELQLNDERTHYLHDGEWRELSVRESQIEVLGESEPRTTTFYESHLGPIVASEGNKAYAAALAYADEIGYLESKYWFMLAEDYEGAIRALEVRQIMPQNVMVADTGGNIYYQRTGRVPIRPEGIDPSVPLDGTTSATEWLGIHPVDDLMTLLNPEIGYMQNCNVGPDTMLPDSPLRPETTLPYLYNQPEMYTHQRGSSAVALLQSREKWSPEQIRELALDPSVYQADRWQEVLAPLERSDLSDNAKRLLRSILEWDGRADANSKGALHYYLFRNALGDDSTSAIRAKIDDHLAPFRPGGEARPVEQLNVHELDTLRHTLEIAALELRQGSLAREQGSVLQIHEEATFGDYFRVGRTDAADDVSWPVSGGSLTREGMATLRSIGFGPVREDGRRWGERGQTSTQVVLLTDPIQSFTQPPIGQSDRPDSPHYRDQAQNLFSPGRLKPSWFAREELLDGNVESEERLVAPFGRQP